MSRVFVDTGFYIGLLRRVDELHLRCADFAKRYDGTFVTSEFVLIELGNWMGQTPLRSSFAELAGRLREDPTTVVLPATADWYLRGLRLYTKRPDKYWSLTDCISFEMMREHGLTEALSADRHFTQAGFHAMLA